MSWLFGWIFNRYTVIALLLYVVISNPTGAANAVKRGGHAIAAAANGASTFAINVLG